ERWDGGLVTNPNCVVTGVALALAPLHRELGLEAVVLTSFQAISGAGRPGPPAADLVDNVLPHIPGEEEKLGPEIRKILGTMGKGRIDDAAIAVSATTTRVPVLHGHLASLSLAFREDADPGTVAEVLREYRSPVVGDELPLAPPCALRVMDEPDRPQPRLDRDAGGGMTVSVGRIRSCPVHHVRMIVLSHNLVRGAAGAALLNAELCRAGGWLESR
ncbi:MAG TPA: aspartate-semialdehyde dehydrogenase, partial [Longimicrobiales bacterium]|nr:aspartate-semialdehyde dehydrogenase [Longimicrobiales bacterium]